MAPIMCPQHREFGVTNMIRQLFIAAAIAATAATAFAAVSPQDNAGLSSDRNVTVIEKNQAFPVIGPVTVEQCAVEDCSDTQV